VKQKRIFFQRYSQLNNYNFFETETTQEIAMINA